MLVELGLVEQRMKAVHEVLDGASVVEVAERYGVVRQTVHTWLKNYATGGMAGLVDKTSRPDGCPHQMPAAMEARIVELRRAHPRWGPQRILDQLAHDGVTSLPGRSSVYRCLVRAADGCTSVSTLLGVSALFEPSVMVELEATAAA